MHVTVEMILVVQFTLVSEAILNFADDNRLELLAILVLVMVGRQAAIDLALDDFVLIYLLVQYLVASFVPIGC